MASNNAPSPIESEIYEGRLIDVTDIAREQGLTWRVFMTPRLLYGEPLRGSMREVANLLLEPRVGVRWFVNESGLNGPKMFVPPTVNCHLFVTMRIQVVRSEGSTVVLMASEFDEPVDYERLCPENGKIPFLL